MVCDSFVAGISLLSTPLVITFLVITLFVITFLVATLSVIKLSVIKLPVATSSPFGQQPHFDPDRPSGQRSLLAVRTTYDGTGLHLSLVNVHDCQWLHDAAGDY